MKGSSYKETEWKNGETRLNAKNMNNIEAGIKTLFENAIDQDTVEVVYEAPGELDNSKLYFVIDAENVLTRLIVFGKEIIVR